MQLWLHTVSGDQLTPYGGRLVFVPLPNMWEGPTKHLFFNKRHHVGGSKHRAKSVVFLESYGGAF